jgi:hypothetical protein
MVSETRSVVLHLRIKPSLQELIRRDATAIDASESQIVRTILAKHYEGK